MNNALWNGSRQIPPWEDWSGIIHRRVWKRLRQREGFRERCTSTSSGHLERHKVIFQSSIGMHVGCVKGRHAVSCMHKITWHIRRCIACVHNLLHIECSCEKKASARCLFLFGFAINFCPDGSSRAFLKRAPWQLHLSKQKQHKATSKDIFDALIVSWWIRCLQSLHIKQYSICGCSRFFLCVTAKRNCSQKKAHSHKSSNSSLYHTGTCLYYECDHSL